METGRDDDIKLHRGWYQDLGLCTGAGDGGGGSGGVTQCCIFD